MASANVTLAGSQAASFAADTTVRVATLQMQGGSFTNFGTDKIWIAENQSTIAIDGSDINSIPIPANGTWPIMPTTLKVAFRADSTTSTINYKPRG